MFKPGKQFGAKSSAKPIGKKSDKAAPAANKRVGSSAKQRTGKTKAWNG